MRTYKCLEYKCTNCFKQNACANYSFTCCAIEFALIVHTLMFAAGTTFLNMFLYSDTLTTTTPIAYM